MFIKIPFESEIDFKSNIREITKMSLEHDYNVNDGVVLGNFYISGEYKSHELSVNTEEFKYTLPFTVELRSDINRESIDFNIEDFSYDIIDNTKLKVNIEYSLSGDIEEEEEDVFERVDEEEMTSDLQYMDDIIENSLVEDKEIKEEKEEIEEKEEKEKKEETIGERSEEELKEENNASKERLDKEEEKTIMEKVENEEDTFVTYHIHIVQESDTFESISTLYKVPVSLINEYNNLDTLNIGDKVLIPLADE